MKLLLAVTPSPVPLPSLRSKKKKKGKSSQKIQNALLHFLAHEANSYKVYKLKYTMYKRQR